MSGNDGVLAKRAAEYKNSSFYNSNPCPSCSPVSKTATAGKQPTRYRTRDCASGRCCACCTCEKCRNRVDDYITQQKLLQDLKDRRARNVVSTAASIPPSAASLEASSSPLLLGAGPSPADSVDVEMLAMSNSDGAASASSAEMLGPDAAPSAVPDDSSEGSNLGAAGVDDYDYMGAFDPGRGDSPDSNNREDEAAAHASEGDIHSETDADDDIPEDEEDRLTVPALSRQYQVQAHRPACKVVVEDVLTVLAIPAFDAVGSKELDGEQIRVLVAGTGFPDLGSPSAHLKLTVSGGM